MTLREAHGKNVKITLKNGHEYIGKAYDYTSALDNDPDPESITIDNTELYETEIEKIEPVDEIARQINHRKRSPKMAHIRQK